MRAAQPLSSLFSSPLPTRALRKARLIPWLLSSAVLGCGGESTPAELGEERFQLHVALFPYIPDATGDGYKGLIARVEAEFELEHPEVDLVLRIDPNDDFYSVGQLASFLSAPPGKGGYHLIETDSIFLGDLAKQELIQPWDDPVQRDDWHPATAPAVTWSGAQYGVPRWLCSYYVITRDPAVAAATDFQAQLQALRADPSPAPDLVGNFISRWDLPALYLSAWAETHGSRDLAAAMTAPVEPDVAASLSALATACSDGGANACIDGTFGDDYDAPAVSFAKGEAAATFGYSERLHIISRTASRLEDISVTRLLLGAEPSPVVYVDSLVRRRDCDSACKAATHAFAEYLTDVDTYAWILMSQDANGAPPRYLLPARGAVYDAPSVAADPFYPKLRASTEGAVAYPNAGLDSSKDRLFEQLCSALPEGHAACAR